MAAHLQLNLWNRQGVCRLPESDLGETRGRRRCMAASDVFSTTRRQRTFLLVGGQCHVEARVEWNLALWPVVGMDAVSSNRNRHWNRSRLTAKQNGEEDLQRLNN
jgi:hypothetical protein